MQTTTITRTTRRPWRSGTLIASGISLILFAIGCGGAGTGFGGSTGGTTGGTTGGLTTGGGTNGGGGGGTTTASKLVTAVEGGQVKTSNGNVTIDIPAGALNNDTLITINAVQPPNSMANFSVAGEVIQFGPRGTQFNVPARITLKYDSLPNGATAADLGMIITDGGAVERLSNLRVDEVKKIVSGDTMHFSYVALMVEPTKSSGVHTVELATGSKSFGVATEFSDNTLKLEVHEDGTICNDTMEVPSPDGLTMNASLGEGNSGQPLEILVDAVKPEVYEPSIKNYFEKNTVEARTDAFGRVSATISKKDFQELVELLNNAPEPVTMRVRFANPVKTRVTYVYPTWYITLFSAGTGLGGGSGSAGIASIQIGGMRTNGDPSSIYGTVNSATRPLHVTVWVKPDGKVGSQPYGAYEDDGIELVTTTSPAMPDATLNAIADFYGPFQPQPYTGFENNDRIMTKSFFTITMVDDYNLLKTDASGVSVLTVPGSKMVGFLRLLTESSDGYARLKYSAQSGGTPLEIWLDVAKSPSWR